MRLNITLIGIAAIAVFAVGCGGGGGDESDGGSTSTSAAKTGTTTNAAKTDTTKSTPSSGTNSSGNPLVEGLSGAKDGAAPLSKAAFIKQADQICRRGGTRIETQLQKHKTEYGRGFGAQPSKKQNEEGVVDLVLPVIQYEAEGIAELAAPPGEEGQVAAIVKALEKGVAQTEANPGSALTRGNKNPLAEATKLSQQYGFKICGS